MKMLQQIKPTIRYGKTSPLFAARQRHNGLEWEQALEAAAREGYDTPSPSRFMPYALQVRDAKEGKTTLYDASNPLGTEEVGSLFAYLFAPVTDDEGIGIWLNGRFVKGSGFRGLDLETRSYSFKGNKTTITIRRNPLEKCLGEDGFADLDALNEQGLLTRRSRKQVYIPGKNVFFTIPLEGCVAGFAAGSGGAFLDCDGDPQNSSSGLGVLTCAEGAQKK